MIYKEPLRLTAGQPVQYDTTNMDRSRNHYLQITDNSSVTVRVSLVIGHPFVELETVTGPGLFEINASASEFELESSADTTVILSGS